MMPIAGTVRNSLKLMQFEAKWQQKKMNITAEKPRAYTLEERQIQQYQQDLEEMRKNRWIAALMKKLEAGEPLTEEEREYLERNNPQALKEYEDIKRERAAYKEELKKCKSKEEAEQLKMNKMNEYLSAAKAIDSNPNIPKAAKVGLMERLMRRLAGMEEEHAEYTKSLSYQNLPDKTYDTAENEHAKMPAAEENAKKTEEDTATCEIADASTADNVPMDVPEIPSMQDDEDKVS